MNFSLTEFLKSETFLRTQSTTRFSESFLLFVNTPLALFGFALNIFSLFIITRIFPNNPAFYKNLEIYCLNSLIICFLSTVSLYVYTPRYTGYKYDSHCQKEQK